MISNYTKFIKRVLLLAIMLLLVDAVVGKSLAVLFLKTKNPAIAKMNYSFYDTKEDILIFGSSRGESHFIPKIIKDSTGLECFNTSLGGQGIFYSYSLLTNILVRYKPKLIVYDLSPNVILDPVALDKISVLLPYYSLNHEIQSVIELKSTFEKIKMCSSIYPYNSLIFSIITGLISNNDDWKRMNGYIPLSDTINNETNKIESKYPEADSNQIIYFTKFLDLASKSGIKVFVTVSPTYYSSNPYKTMLAKFKTITAYYNFEFYDNSFYPGITLNKKLFRDPLHMNNNGAKIYSEEIASIIYKRLQSK